MKYQSDFEERKDVFKFSLDDVTLYFIPTEDGKYEFCSKGETENDKKIQDWMNEKEKQEVAFSSIKFVIRDAFEKVLNYSRKEGQKVFEEAEENMAVFTRPYWESIHASLLEKQNETDALTYMSDMNNWVCVHVAEEEPKKNAEGKLCIKAVAAEDKVPDNRVHVALNQIVEDGVGSVVVLAPYNDIVKKNGNPAEVAAEDTYFSPDSNKGLLLPDSAYIVKAVSNERAILFEIGEHCAIYKNSNYTKTEIDFILSLKPDIKQEYDKYTRKDVTEEEIKSLLGNNEMALKWYNASEDKSAFIRGVLGIELDRILQNFVAQASMDKMGYQYVSAHENDVSRKINDVARKAGLRRNSEQKLMGVIAALRIRNRR